MAGLSVDRLQELLDARPDRAERVLRRLRAEHLRLAGHFWSVPGGLVVRRDKDGFSVLDAGEWIYEVDTDEIFPEEEERFDRDFWERPGLLFHNTNSARWSGIKREGLLPTNLTRGLSNRGTGPAVFTTTNIELAESGLYGDMVVSINARKMKENGLTPLVAEEAPHRRYKLRRRLIHMLDLDLEPDSPDDVDPETVVVFGSIPPQFLSRVS